MVIEKPVRVRAPKYKDWVRLQPCCCTGRHFVDPHHRYTVGAGGSDHSVVPMGRIPHGEIDNLGTSGVEKKYGVNLDKIICLQLNRFYGEPIPDNPASWRDAAMTMIKRCDKKHGKRDDDNGI